MFERNGRRFARIVPKAGYIDVCIGTLEESHLGDQVLVDLEITAQSVRQEDTVAGSAREIEY